MKGKGQFLILTSIMMTTAILILIAMVTNSNIRILNSQKITVPLPLINAVEDFPRALKVSLKLSSISYNSSNYNLSYANSTAYTFINNWMDNFTYIHGGRGVSVYINYFNVSFQWNSSNYWWSNATCSIIIDGKPAGFSEINKIIRYGIIITDLVKLDNQINVTAYMFNSEIPVKLKVLQVKVNGSTVNNWIQYYYGLGVNGVEIDNISLNNASSIEILFEFQGILIKVHRDYSASS